METDRSLLGESRTSFLSHRECIEEEYEYANKFEKQGKKNPRNNIPKFTINHQRFFCARKISDTYAHEQSLLILIGERERANLVVRSSGIFYI